MKQLYENHIFKHSLEIKKSLFITLIKKITNEEQAKAFIAKHRKSDADHNCFAYIIGENKQIQRKSDDGEPLNSAGKPILNILLLKNLTNIVVLIVRFKTGGKLGASLLARSYANSINDALKLATLIAYEKTSNITFTVGVSNDKWIMQLLSSINLPIHSYTKDYDNDKFKYYLNNINLTIQQKLQTLQAKNIIDNLTIIE